MRRATPAALTALLLAVGAARPAEPAAEARRADELVSRLGDVSFPARQEASAELLRLGVSAKDALARGAGDPDPEVRRRCRDLLPAVLEADRQARVAAFLADKDGTKDPGLPGWPRYRRLAGDSTASRAFFAEMQKGEAGMFLADCAAAPEQAGELAQGLAQSLQQKLISGRRLRGGARPGASPPDPTSPVPLGDVGALLFVASDPAVRMPTQATWVVPQLLYQGPARSALGGGAQPSPLRKLLGAWLNRPTDDFGLQQALHLAMNFDLKEGADLARKAVEGKKARGQSLATALVALGKLGGKEQLGLVESALGDATPLGDFEFNNVKGSTEIRDVALAMAVHLSGQSHKDYGFAFVRLNSSLLFNSGCLGFASPQEREAAHRKWKAQAQPKK
jgi:hypothetical protein